MKVENSAFDSAFPCREIVGQAVPLDLQEHVLRIMQAHGGNARYNETATAFIFPEGTVKIRMGWPATREARYRIRFPDKYEVYETYLGEKRGSLVAFHQHEFPSVLLTKYKHNWLMGHSNNRARSREVLSGDRQKRYLAYVMMLGRISIIEASNLCTYVVSFQGSKPL